MSDETCHHRDFTVKSDKMEDGAEQLLYAECDVCGQKKSALVDWARDSGFVGPVSDGEWNHHVEDDLATEDEE